MAQSIADKITWCAFDSKSEALVPKSIVAKHYKYNFSVKKPNRWQDGSYTAIITDNSMILYEWLQTNLGEELFEIKVFDIAAWDQGKVDGYTLIYRDNRYAYAFSNPPGNSPMKLSNDEIKTAFSADNSDLEPQRDVTPTNENG
jgi:hypothetical protein